MSIVGIIVLVFLMLLIFGGLPQTGLWNHGMGYAPSGIGTILLVIVVLWLLGVFR
jgi:Protein of unknown function (DUF3309)